ncbi:ATP-dependent DNA helicase PIF1-like protein [Tanacetum coccineum]
MTTDDENANVVGNQRDVHIGKRKDYGSNYIARRRITNGTAKLLRAAKLIIWDEASMAKMQAIKALDRSMQDITEMKLLLGGKIMVLGDPWFSDFLLQVGNGDEQAVDENYFRIPDDMTIPYNDMARSKEDLINAIFPSLHVNGNSSDYIISRAILSTKNEHVDELNKKSIDRFCEDEKIYYSFDEAQDDKNNFYHMEFLNSLNVSGLPPRVLRLKIGCPIILLRNLDPSVGLCNGTRLICR